MVDSVAKTEIKTDRLLLFGGSYSNLQATEALFREADRLGFAGGEMLCTGDIVAYCGDPQGTVDLIRHKEVPVVMGNCEESLAADSDDCGCGFESGSLCDLLSAQWYNYSRVRLSDESKRWMGSLPRSISVFIGGFELQAIHGGLDQISRFIFPSTPAEVKRDQLNRTSALGILAGHSGIPFIEGIDAGVWCNSGALGMPANDGTPRVWYATLETGHRGLRFSTHALTYDYEAAATAMKAGGLDNGYERCLSTGLWPSLDVLPERERQETGKPLQGFSFELEFNAESGAHRAMAQPEAG